MSRAYNARRKAKRQAQAAVERESPRRRRSYRLRHTALAPVLLIVAIFAVVGVLGFGTGAGVNKSQVEREVTELLDGIPQKGAVLGAPTAPITVWVYADLQCPTVKLFVENYLPSIIETWVRPGAVKLEYRSLQTDTSNERIFFEQEIASLAAGRQARMWNFALTFVRQQEGLDTNYVTQEFLTDIASQVPELELAQWRRDRDDALLSKNVALDVYSGHARALQSTPAVLYGITSNGERSSVFGDRAEIERELAASLGRDMESLGDEAFGDSPSAEGFGSNLQG